MSGTFAPISDRYSPELRQLVLSLLSLEPAQRPPLSHIMAQPLCMRALLNLHTDLGSVRMRRPVPGQGSQAVEGVEDRGTRWNAWEGPRPEAQTMIPQGREVPGHPPTSGEQEQQRPLQG